MEDILFWSHQYTEHCEFIHKSTEDESVREKCLYFLHRWESVDPNSDLRSLLESFYTFKKELYASVLNGEVESWLSPSVFEDMITEVEYLLEPRTDEKVLLFWLKNMQGHAAISSDWIDPVHLADRQKLDTFSLEFLELREDLGLSEGDDLETMLKRKAGQSADEEHVRKNWDVVVLDAIRLQMSMTNYYTELIQLKDEGLLLGTITREFLVHTLNECLQAERELNSLKD